MICHSSREVINYLYAKSDYTKFTRSSIDEEKTIFAFYVINNKLEICKFEISDEPQKFTFCNIHNIPYTDLALSLISRSFNI